MAISPEVDVGYANTVSTDQRTRVPRDRLNAGALGGIEVVASFDEGYRIAGVRTRAITSRIGPERNHFRVERAGWGGVLAVGRCGCGGSCESTSRASNCPWIAGAKSGDQSGIVRCWPMSARSRISGTLMQMVSCLRGARLLGRAGWMVAIAITACETVEDAGSGQGAGAGASFGVVAGARAEAGRGATAGPTAGSLEVRGRSAAREPPGARARERTEAPATPAPPCSRPSRR